jgi:hypothetical protein
MSIHTTTLILIALTLPRISSPLFTASARPSASTRSSSPAA